eukprot:TRINITY_DN44549_c0_g1_i1.p1 TRINITY_DN44549_c0_g1~~TRINITY_DN44549_c0_g1_i1.p1  ORF type:complete len:345 (-),score=25.68 TRINITY_DN44549_c0_g1_i1:145-1179(-)
MVLSDSSNVTTSRLLVVGDSGVGKSSLIGLICDGNAALVSKKPTIGASVEVKLYQSANNRYHCVEFVEVGGNAKYRPQARYPFYNNFDGIIFVYDLTDASTLGNVWIWMKEIQEAISVRGTKRNPLSTTNGKAGHLHSAGNYNMYNSGSSTTGCSTTYGSLVGTPPLPTINRRPQQAATSFAASRGVYSRPTAQSYDTSEDRPHSVGYTTDHDRHSSGGEGSSAAGALGYLIVGTRADLCGTDEAHDSWVVEFLRIWGKIKFYTTRFIQRVLFLPLPATMTRGEVGNLHVVDPVTSCPVEFLKYLESEWKATAVKIDVLNPQEESMQKIEKFISSVGDASCLDV